MVKFLNRVSQAIALLATAGAVFTCVVAIAAPTPMTVCCSYAAISAAVSAWLFCD